jgi:hypothetical protein
LTEEDTAVTVCGTSLAGIRDVCHAAEVARVS